MQKQYSSRRTINGKVYRVIINEKPKKTERYYELDIRSRSIEQFDLEDQEVFQSMENDLDGMNMDFSGLEEELKLI